MSDQRTVSMDAAQHEDIEHYIVALMHADDRERASRMMSLALSWKFAKPEQPPLPTNVYPIVRHEGDNWSRRVPSA